MKNYSLGDSINEQSRGPFNNTFISVTYKCNVYVPVVLVSKNNSHTCNLHL